MKTSARERLAFFAVGLLLTVALSGIIWAIHRESPRTLVSFHGFVHAGIETRFLEPATMQFPPENPFYAGEPLCYYWFYQFTAALLARSFGLNIFHALEALGFLAVAVLVFSGLKLGKAVYGSVSAGVVIVFLVLAGTNPLGALLAISRILRLGTDVLTDNGTYLWGVVGPLYGLIRYGDAGGVYGPFLNFFLNITSRPVALALLVVLVACLARAWGEPRVGRLAYVALAAAAVAAFNPMMGLAVTGSLVFGFLAVLSMEWNARGRTERIRHKLAPGLRISATLLLGTLLAAPTYYHLLTGPSERGIHLRWPLGELLRHSSTVVFSLALLLGLALYGAYRIHCRLRSFSWALIAAALPLVLGSMLLRFAASNESNFFHAAAVLLVVPAIGSIVQPIDTARLIRWRTLTLLLVFAPSSILLAESYLRRPPVPMEFSGKLATRIPADSDLARLYAWVKAETPPDAIFILDPRNRITAGGNVSEFPAMTARVLFTEVQHHYLVSPYADAARRQQIAVKLQTGQELNGPERDLLQSFQRPVFIVLRQERPGPRSEVPTDLSPLLVFKGRQIEVYRINPQRQAKHESTMEPKLVPWR